MMYHAINASTSPVLQVISQLLNAIIVATVCYLSIAGFHMTSLKLSILLRLYFSAV